MYACVVEGEGMGNEFRLKLRAAFAGPENPAFASEDETVPMPFGIPNDHLIFAPAEGYLLRLDLRLRTLGDGKRRPLRIVTGLFISPA